MGRVASTPVTHMRRDDRGGVAGGAASGGPYRHRHTVQATPATATRRVPTDSPATNEPVARAVVATACNQAATAATTATGPRDLRLVLQPIGQAAPEQVYARQGQDEGDARQGQRVGHAWVLWYAPMAAPRNAASAVMRALELAALFAAAASISWALLTGSARRHYDVDEIQHAHVMWRISVGDRPFHDFVESHPPFVWYLGAPLVKALPGPAEALRVAARRGHGVRLVFMVLVLACGRAGQPGLTLPWLAAGGLLALCHRATLDYFVEARPDSLAYCLLFGAFVLFLRDRPRLPFARYATFAFLASTALLWTPKFALLVVAFAAIDLVVRWRTAGGAGSALAGHATGIALAVAGALLFFKAGRHRPPARLRPVHRLPRPLPGHHRVSYGLWRSIMAQPVPLAFAGAGVLAWIALIALPAASAPRRSSWPPSRSSARDAVPDAPAVQAVLRPLVRAVGGVRPLPGPRPAPVERTRAPGSPPSPLLAFAAFSGWRVSRDYAKADPGRVLPRGLEVMREAAVPGGRVVADPQWHPVYRRDVFYGWFSTFDPGGRGQERILREWNPRGYGARFTGEGYRRELDAHPPALIVTVGDGFNLPATQEQATVARTCASIARSTCACRWPASSACSCGVTRRTWKYLTAAGHALRP